ncbi:MAG: branched-chain amino acid ABC transporter permease [Candidatus Heimdallarchaeota archaeon]|nr:branched-chain amino acid ABC transporter permease [Candidatus Heimdallarchaeota archaeon]
MSEVESDLPSQDRSKTYLERNAIILYLVFIAFLLLTFISKGTISIGRSIDISGFNVAGLLGSLIVFAWKFDRKQPHISNIFTIGLVSAFLVLVVSRDSANPTIWITSILISVSIFGLMAIGLNLHTGMTGMVNFGVIFFVGIGAVTTGLLNSKYGVDPWISLTTGIVIAMVVGYLTAFPTIRLRADYFAIVTIALGEILRIVLNVETTLRSRTESSGISSPGIANIRGPWLDVWENAFPDRPYLVLLTIISVSLLALGFVLSELILNSPFGRVLKTIREDEDVVQSYGYNVFQYKALILAIGGGVMAAAGGVWAWWLGSIFPDFMLPTSSTFLVWAAFVIGGKGNNKGMIIGAAFITYIELISRTITPPPANVSFRTCVAESSFVVCSMDVVFRFIVLDIGGLLFGSSSYTTATRNASNIHIDVNFLRLIVIGLIILLSMRYFTDGLVPEEPFRPKIDYFRSSTTFEGALRCQFCNQLNQVGAEVCVSCGKRIITSKSSKE